MFETIILHQRKIETVENTEPQILFILNMLKFEHSYFLHTLCIPESVHLLVFSQT